MAADELRPDTPGDDKRDRNGNSAVRARRARRKRRVTRFNDVATKLLHGMGWPIDKPIPEDVLSQGRRHQELERRIVDDIADGRDGSPEHESRIEAQRRITADLRERIGGGGSGYTDATRRSSGDPVLALAEALIGESADLEDDALDVRGAEAAIATLESELTQARERLARFRAATDAQATHAAVERLRETPAEGSA